MKVANGYLKQYGVFYGINISVTRSKWAVSFGGGVVKSYKEVPQIQYTARCGVSLNVRTICEDTWSLGGDIFHATL